MASGMGGVAEQGQGHFWTIGYITAVEDDGHAELLDAFGKVRRVPMAIRRGKGPRPQVGEQWIIDRSYGYWSFAACIEGANTPWPDSGPPEVSGDTSEEKLEGLLTALSDLGYIREQESEVEPEVVFASPWSPGDLKTSARSTPEAGWLVCNGSTLLVAEYRDLYEAIGLTWGGTGVTFVLPDYRGRTIIGAGAGDALTERSLGDDGGAEAVGLDTTEIPAHTHGSEGSHQHAATGDHSHTPATGTGKKFVTDVTSGGAVNFSVAGGTPVTKDTNSATNTTGSHQHDAAGDHTHASVGGGEDHENMPPFGVANVFIKT